MLHERRSSFRRPSYMERSMLDDLVPSPRRVCQNRSHRFRIEDSRARVIHHPRYCMYSGGLVATKTNGTHAGRTRAKPLSRPDAPRAHMATRRARVRRARDGESHSTVRRGGLWAAGDCSLQAVVVASAGRHGRYGARRHSAPDGWACLGERALALRRRHSIRTRRRARGGLALARHRLLYALSSSSSSPSRRAPSSACLCASLHFTSPPRRAGAAREMRPRCPHSSPRCSSQSQP